MVRVHRNGCDAVIGGECRCGAVTVPTDAPAREDRDKDLLQDVIAVLAEQVRLATGQRDEARCDARCWRRCYVTLARQREHEVGLLRARAAACPPRART